MTTATDIPGAAAPQPAPTNADEFTRTELGEKKSGWESEELSPEELAYFNSRGNDTAGLGVAPEPVAPRAPVTPDGGPLTPQPAYTPPPAPAPTPVAAEAPRAPVTPDGAPLTPPQPAAPAPNSEAVGEDEEVDFDTLTVDAQGVMRDPRGRYVPHSALHKARERFKSERARADTATTELTQLRQNLATMEGRFAQLNDLLAQRAAPAQPAAPAPAPEPVDEAPDPQTDIFGYAAWQGRQIAKMDQRITALQETATKKVEEVSGQLTEANMMQSYKGDAQAYAAAKPEFAQAYRHLIDSRNAELTLMGYTDPNQRMQVIREEEAQLVRKAYEQRKRPAEFIHNVAIMRGFRHAPPAAPTAAPAPAPAPAAAVVPPPAAPVPVPNSATPAAINHAQALANQAAARAASATLSGVGGAGSDALTADAIANMSEAEFEALYHKMGGKRGGMRQFLGA